MSFKNASLHDSYIFSRMAVAAIVIKKKCTQTDFSNLFLRKFLYEESRREELLSASSSAFLFFVFSAQQLHGRKLERIVSVQQLLISSFK